MVGLCLLGDKIRLEFIEHRFLIARIQLMRNVTQYDRAREALVNTPTNVLHEQYELINANRVFDAFRVKSTLLGDWINFVNLR